MEKFSCHYEADLEKDGRSVLDLRPLLWTADGWPLPGENVRDGTYQILSQWTGTVLQSSTNSASPVQTASYLAHDDQKWIISLAGGGFYKIINAAGTNSLEATDGTATVAPFTGGDAQLWKVDLLADGSHRIASKAGKLALTAAAKTNPGNRIALQPFTGDDTQRWVIAAP